MYMNAGGGNSTKMNKNILNGRNKKNHGTKAKRWCMRIVYVGGEEKLIYIE
jgi:hypothetical protein